MNKTNKNELNLMKYKIFYLIFSAVVLLPGIIFLLFFGLKLSIDFTGGSLIKYEFQSETSKSDIERVLTQHGVEVESIVFSGLKTNDSGTSVTIRTKVVDTSKNDEIKATFQSEFPGSNQQSFETVGPSIGVETAKNAFIALALALIGIFIYIAIVFRNVPKPYSSTKFGLSALIAMFHDAVLVIGIFSILGYFFGTEVDALFITAVLTIIGFSVHDTIVVFDRIRENLKKMPQSWGFEKIVNFSIVETLNRSLATSLTVIITLSSLYVLGGESIKDFVLAMLIGIILGTYSSIFTASPILVLWEERSKRRKLK